MKKTTLIAWAFCLLNTPSVFGQIITSSQIDSLVEKVLTTFDVPGISVAVVKICPNTEGYESKQNAQAMSVVFFIF